MRIALVHDYWVTLRGGERIFMGLSRLFPEAECFTLIRDPRLTGGPALHSTWLQWIPSGWRHYRALLPLYPLATRSLDLRRYDLVISSSSGFCHGVRTSGIHVCYCHSPLRYAWQEYEATITGLRFPVARLLLAATLRSLRARDYEAAQRVSRYVANSHTTQRHIAAFYGRESDVVHPFIDFDRFHPTARVEDYFLVVSQLLPYKRVDLAVAACTQLGRRLVVVGEGPDRSRLQALAGPTVTFAGRVSEPELATLYARCAALVQCGVEDFGMAALEAQAAGRPVLAYGEGGARETVIHQRTGLHIATQTVEAVTAALRGFDPADFAVTPIREHARQFDEPHFRRGILAVLRQAGVPGEIWQRAPGPV